MKKIASAIALAIAIPSVAHAQDTVETAKPMPCCEKMKAEGKECCCKDMAEMDHSEHSAGQGSGASQPPAPHSH